MLLPEARLETLLDQLDALPRADRKAILARLSPRERARLRARRRAPGRPASPFSPDIAARVAAAMQDGADVPITDAGRAALARALAASAGAAAQADAPAGGSLLDAIAGLWRRSA